MNISHQNPNVLPVSTVAVHPGDLPARYVMLRREKQPPPAMTVNITAHPVSLTPVHAVRLILSTLLYRKARRLVIKNSWMK